MAAALHADAQRGERLRLRWLAVVMEEAKEEMMARLFAVKERVLLWSRTEAEEAREAHVDSLMVLLGVRFASR